MATEEQQQLPELILLHPFTLVVLGGGGGEFSRRFRLLKAWESPLPVLRYLADHGGAARALLTLPLAPVGEDALAVLPNLGLVVTTSVGFDHVDLAACALRGVAVANAGGVFSEDAADYAVSMLIDVLRRVSAADRYVRAGSWPLKGEFPLGTKLGGKRVGIIGLGSIGSEVAKRLEAFGCHVSYTSRTKKALAPYPYFPTSRDLAADSDALIVCCALTDETRHIVDGEVMRALGKDGVIVNVGRGMLVDEKELARRLASGEIGGAGLDVFEAEPSVPSELLGMDNVVLSPHCSVNTTASLTGVRDVVWGNLEAFFEGRPLLTPVSAER